MKAGNAGEALAQEAALMRKLGAQLAELQTMALAELRARHLDLFGEEAKSKNLPFLRRKLAFRLQERAEGGLSPEARARIEKLAPAELPTKAKVVGAPRKAALRAPEKMPARDARLPVPGTVLRREFRGLEHAVDVREDGFSYRGRTYRSLSALAKEITGTVWNGFAFFNLMKGVGHGEG